MLHTCWLNENHLLDGAQFFFYLQCVTFDLKINKLLVITVNIFTLEQRSRIILWIRMGKNIHIFAVL